MPTKRSVVNFICGGSFAALMALGAPPPAIAQVVVMVNGAPITALDIDQRSRLTQITTNTAPTRQQTIEDLINDQLKLSIAKRYSFEVTDAEVDEGFANMARRSRRTPEQMSELLASRGVQAKAMKARLRAEITWSQFLRGKFASTLNISDSEVNLALRSRNADEKDAIGYTYTLYPIMFIAPRGSSQATLQGKLKAAESLRTQFTSCRDGLPLARTMRDVAVREPMLRNSADLTPQLRELLTNMEVGRLTQPEPAEQGLQMFALCDKKSTTMDSPIKREVREQIFSKRFETEGKKFLEELRRQAMIEYR